MVDSADRVLLLRSWKPVFAFGEDSARMLFQHLCEGHPDMAPLFEHARIPALYRKFMGAMKNVMTRATAEGPDALGSLERYLKQVGEDHVTYGVSEMHFTPFFSSFLHVIREVNSHASNSASPPLSPPLSSPGSNNNTAGTTWTPAMERAWCSLFVMIQRGMAGKSLICPPAPSPKASPRTASASPSRMGRTRYNSAERSRLSPLASSHAPTVPVTSPHAPLTDPTFDSFIYDFASPSSTSSSRAPSPPPPLPPDLLLSVYAAMPSVPSTNGTTPAENRANDTAPPFTHSSGAAKLAAPTAAPANTRGRTMEGSRTRAPPPLPTSSPPTAIPLPILPSQASIQPSVPSYADIAARSHAAVEAINLGTADSAPVPLVQSHPDANIVHMGADPAPDIKPIPTVAVISHAGANMESSPRSASTASVNKRGPRMSHGRANIHTIPAAPTSEPNPTNTASFNSIAPAETAEQTDKSQISVEERTLETTFESLRSTISGQSAAPMQGSSITSMDAVLSPSDPSFCLDVHMPPIPASLFCMPPPTDEKGESDSTPAAYQLNDKLSPVFAETFSVKRKLELSSPALSAVHITPNSTDKAAAEASKERLLHVDDAVKAGAVVEAGSVSPVVVGVTAALFGIAIGAAAVVFLKAQSRR